MFVLTRRGVLRNSHSSGQIESQSMSHKNRTHLHVFGRKNVFFRFTRELPSRDGQEGTLTSTEARNVSHTHGIPLWWCLFLSLESSMIFPFLCALILRHFAGLKVRFFELSLCIANCRLTRIIFVRKFCRAVRMFDRKVRDFSRKILKNKGRLSSKFALITFAQYCIVQCLIWVRWLYHNFVSHQQINIS